MHIATNFIVYWILQEDKYIAYVDGLQRTLNRYHKVLSSLDQAEVRYEKSTVQRTQTNDEPALSRKLGFRPSVCLRDEHQNWQKQMTSVSYAAEATFPTASWITWIHTTCVSPQGGSAVVQRTKTNDGGAYHGCEVFFRLVYHDWRTYDYNDKQPDCVITETIFSQDIADFHLQWRLHERPCCVVDTLSCIQ